MSFEQAGSTANDSNAQDEIAHIEPPPGWMGLIARFIFNHSPYPNPTISIMAALALMSVLFGRIVNVSGTGLNLYKAIVGGTGIGKEAAASGISKLISHVGKTVPAIHDLIGPSSLASPEAAHKRVGKTPSVLLFIGEFGIKLKMWCAPNANSVYAGLVAFYLEVFGKSGRGNRLGARENSDKDKGAAAVESPNVVVLGDTTETTLLEALTEANLANGFIPRFIFGFAGEFRSALNRFRQLLPPSELVEWVADTAAQSLTNQRNGIIFDIALDDEAQAIDDEIEASTTEIINNSKSEFRRHLYSRARLNILKVAALVACGDIKDKFEIRADHILWAKKLVISGIERLLSKVESGEFGEVGGNEAKQLNEAIRVISEYVHLGYNDVAAKYNVNYEMHCQGVVPESYIQRRLHGLAPFKNDKKAGATNAIKRAIKSLLEADDLREMPPSQMIEKFGSKPRAYALSNPHRFKMP